MRLRRAARTRAAGRLPPKRNRRRATSGSRRLASSGRATRQPQSAGDRCAPSAAAADAALFGTARQLVGVRQLAAGQLVDTWQLAAGKPVDARQLAADQLVDARRLLQASSSTPGSLQSNTLKASDLHQAQQGEGGATRRHRRGESEACRGTKRRAMKIAARAHSMVRWSMTRLDASLFRSMCSGQARW